MADSFDEMSRSEIMRAFSEGVLLPMDSPEEEEECFRLSHEEDCAAVKAAIEALIGVSERGLFNDWLNEELGAKGEKAIDRTLGLLGLRLDALTGPETEPSSCDVMDVLRSLES